MPVFKIRVPEVWYQIYYVRGSDPDTARRDFRAGLTEHKVGECEYEETLDLHDSHEWPVEEVDTNEEISYVRMLPISKEQLFTE